MSIFGEVGADHGYQREVDTRAAVAKQEWFDAVFGPLAVELRGLRNEVPPPRHAPSREFMIQQATLNALAQHMPAATRLDGASSAMRHLVALCGWEHGQPSDWFCRSVRDHFAVIEAQYD